ncbi:MAG: bifunctional DNA-formamidopyrimidine glycosylase/DNA-(apurinic or apyrimidinic site) lyase [Deltaproteobacteria bacterium]|nr:bifunctional DNA-formamidopyrimidine glycosylase/DNA-(apurinic or apyrimidinic site) lyase [Deltaproteobacteria bacterium]
MPELPEVESLTRAIRVVLEGSRLESAQFLRPDLRTPIPIEVFRSLLEGEVIEAVTRRSKYMLIKSRNGYGVFHLGMTGKILEQDSPVPRLPHTHAVFAVRKPRGKVTYLHFVDPRRFGRIEAMPLDQLSKHELFVNLGPEPLECEDLGDHLYRLSRGRKAPIKNFIMDAHTVVGVGNIYASEALFRAGINPRRKAGLVSYEKYKILSLSIKETLSDAIAAGGTTFRDFKTPDGNPGYFVVALNVYDRVGQACKKCASTIRQIKQGGRSTFFCPVCQK